MCVAAGPAVSRPTWKGGGLGIPLGERPSPSHNVGSSKVAERGVSLWVCDAAGPAVSRPTWKGGVLGILLGEGPSPSHNGVTSERGGRKGCVCVSLLGLQSPVLPGKGGHGDPQPTPRMSQVAERGVSVRVGVAAGPAVSRPNGKVGARGSLLGNDPLHPPTVGRARWQKGV